MQLQRRDAHLATRTAEARLAVAWLQAAPWCANGAALIFFVTSVVQKTNHQTNGLYSLALRDPSLPLALSCPGWLQKGLLPIFKNTKKYEKIQPKNRKSELRVWKIQLVGFVFFFVFWFLISKSEHGVGSLAYF